MIGKKVVLFCLVLVVLAVSLQTAPRILGSAFAYAVIPSGLPVYIATRLNGALGISVFFTAAALSACINMGEALFFICASGIVGLTLGIMKDRFRNTYFIPLPSVLIVFTMLSSVNYLLGIRIFGNSNIGVLIPKALALVPQLYIYCLIYLKLSMFVEELLHRNLELYNY